LRILSIVLTVILFLVALGLALVNTQPAELRFFPFGEQAVATAPLVVWLCAFFLLGVIVGLLGAMPAWIRLRLRTRKAEKQVSTLRDAAARAGLTAGVNASGQKVAKRSTDPELPALGNERNLP
jgi:uncharacterized membrane protein YciS (DUF1049 family)